MSIIYIFVIFGNLKGSDDDQMQAEDKMYFLFLFFSPTKCFFLHYMSWGKKNAL